MTGPRLMSNLQPRKGILKKYKKIRDVDKKKIGYHIPDFVINFRQNIQLNKQNNYIHIFPRDPGLHIYR